jgi:hypothetical protein
MAAMVSTTAPTNSPQSAAVDPLYAVEMLQSVQEG